MNSHDGEHYGNVLLRNVAGPKFEYFAVTKETFYGEGGAMFGRATSLYYVYKQRRHSGEIFGSARSRHMSYEAALNAAMGREINII